MAAVIHLSGAGTQYLQTGDLPRRLPREPASTPTSTVETVPIYGSVLRTREVGPIPHSTLCGFPLDQEEARRGRVIAPHDHPDLCPACATVRPHAPYSQLVGMLLPSREVPR